MNKNKKVIGGLILVVLAGVLIWYFVAKDSQTLPPVSVDNGEEAYVVDYKEGVYKIDDSWVKITAGEEKAPGEGGYMNIETRVDVGGEDWDGMPLEDVVFWFSHDAGGSGTFYYVAVAMNTRGGFIGTTKSYFVGDRIKPTDLKYNDGVFTVRYKDRADGEPMSNAPTVNKTLQLRYDEATEALVLVE